MKYGDIKYTVIPIINLKIIDKWQIFNLFFIINLPVVFSQQTVSPNSTPTIRYSKNKQNTGSYANNTVLNTLIVLNTYDMW